MRALIASLSFIPELPEWKDFTWASNDSGHHIAVMRRLIYLIALRSTRSANLLWQVIRKVALMDNKPFRTSSTILPHALDLQRCQFAIAGTKKGIVLNFIYDSIDTTRLKKLLLIHNSSYVPNPIDIMQVAV
uniref:Uncharacterized protein n=1 Tax=Opuntia streptacantha TaxID=393608 RepID=A0A7C9ESY6_OPUST